MRMACDGSFNASLPADSGTRVDAQLGLEQEHCCAAPAVVAVGMLQRSLLP